MMMMKYRPKLDHYDHAHLLISRRALPLDSLVAMPQDPIALTLAIAARHKRQRERHVLSLQGILA